MVAELTPTQQRCANPTFVANLSFLSISPKLPLSLPVGDHVPPSVKRHYRCHYVYLGCKDPFDVILSPTLSLFDLALRLIDFSSLEALLASIVYSQSPRGHVPFHPVSMFLLYSWRIINKWNRGESLRYLADARYDDYRQRFGFAKGDYPTEGGLRHFETMLASASDDGLIAQSIELAQSVGCISSAAVVAGILGADGMIHDAASRMRCSSVDDPCYQSGPRSCAAKEKGRKGCECQELGCASACKHATPRDPKARFIVYQGHNQTNSPNAPVDGPTGATSARGKPRYGYRSVCARLIDPLWRTSWVLADQLLPANAPEDKTATELMKDVVRRYDWVDWKFVVADAGEGRDPFLSTAYELGLRRVVGLRADKSDEDVEGWKIRGYDDKGIPVCPFGYRLHPNGWDEARRRHKWCCRRTCQGQGDPPAPDCPHRWDGDKHGLVRDIGKTFPDGSNRLVRDVPYGSSLYKQLYGRGRNATEERNSEFEALGLKRMPVYGWERVRAMVTVVDMWVNLTTMMRLIREAVLTAKGLSLSQ
jgi:hypothetical protein